MNHPCTIRLFAVTAVTLVALSAQPPSAHADRAKARDAFVRGRAYFKKGEYVKALVELKKAYKLEPAPALLRYMAQTYIKLNDARQALDHYKRYLKAAPQAPDRVRVTARIHELELVLGGGKPGPKKPPKQPQDKPPQDKPPSATSKPSPKIDLAPTGEDSEVPAAIVRRKPAPPPPSTPTSTAGVLKWTALGVGVAGIALGVTFSVLAAGKASAIEDAVATECPAAAPDCGGNPSKDNPQVAYSKEHHDLLQAHERFKIGAIVGYAVGGAAAAAAAVFFVLDGGGGSERAGGKASRRAVQLAPSLAPGSYGLVGSVRF